MGTPGDFSRDETRLRTPLLNQSRGPECLVRDAAKRRHNQGPISPLPNRPDHEVSAERAVLAVESRSSLRRACQPDVTLLRENIAQMRAVTQVDAKFIVARVGDEQLVIVDQHAAGERVELERLQDLLLVHRTGVNLVPVRNVEVTITSEEARWLDRHRTHLESWGFRFKNADSGACTMSAVTTFTVSHVPEIFGTQLLPTDSKAMLAEAEEMGGSASVVPRVVQHILCFKACRRAVKFGDPLSARQMADLLSRLSSCKFPFQCAHGRPTVYPLIGLASLRACCRSVFSRRTHASKPLHALLKQPRWTRLQRGPRETPRRR